MWAKKGDDICCEYQSVGVDRFGMVSAFISTLEDIYEFQLISLLLWHRRHPTGQTHETCFNLICPGVIDNKIKIGVLNLFDIISFNIMMYRIAEFHIYILISSCMDEDVSCQFLGDVKWCRRKSLEAINIKDIIILFFLPDFGFNLNDKLYYATIFLTEWYFNRTQKEGSNLS